MSFLVQKALSSHREAIIDFQLKMALESEGIQLDGPVVRRGVSEVFERPSLGQYYVVISNGTVVASTLIQYEWSDWRAGMVWWIHSVYVVPEFRKQGVFKRIYQFLKSEAQRVGHVKALRLYVEKNNQIAKACYESLGMTSQRYDLYEEMIEGH